MVPIVIYITKSCSCFDITWHFFFFFCVTQKKGGNKKTIRCLSPQLFHPRLAKCGGDISKLKTQAQGKPVFLNSWLLQEKTKMGKKSEEAHLT